MFCARKSYRDFVVWMQNDVHIERIYPDEHFWLTNVAKAKNFFQTSLLPELLGKFYSHDSVRQHCPSTELRQSQEPSCSGTSTDHMEYHQGSSDEEDDNVQLPLYCYCQRPEEGDMIGCDNPTCSYQWFHLSCLKLNSLPKCKHWSCPDCRKMPRFKRKKLCKQSQS